MKFLSFALLTSCAVTHAANEPRIPFLNAQESRKICDALKKDPKAMEILHALEPKLELLKYISIVSIATGIAGVTYGVYSILTDT